MIHFWDLAQGKELSSHKAHVYSVTALAFSPDGKRLASGGNDSTIRFWNVPQGTEYSPLGIKPVDVSWTGFLSDGNTLISTGGDQFIFWEATTGKLIRALDRPNERSLSGLSPDTKTLTTWNRRDYAIRLWDIASGKEIRRFAQEGISYSAFSPNARMLKLRSRNSGM